MPFTLLGVVACAPGAPREIALDQSPPTNELAKHDVSAGRGGPDAPESIELGFEDSPLAPVETVTRRAIAATATTGLAVTAAIGEPLPSFGCAMRTEPLVLDDLTRWNEVASRAPVELAPADDTSREPSARQGARDATPPDALRGRVVWPDGSAAAEATVNILIAKTFEQLVADAQQSAPREATSFPLGQGLAAGADGAFRYARGTGAHVVYAYAKKFPPEDPKASKSERNRARREAPRWSVGPISVDLPAKEPLELVLEPGVPVLGRVVDDLGEPVKRFQLRACSKSLIGLFPETLGHSVRSSDARFEWRDLGRGRWDIVASASGYTTSPVLALELASSSPPAELELVVRRPARMAGRLVDARGAPCAKTWIGAVYDRGTSWLFEYAQVAATTDDDGRFTIERVIPDPFVLEAQLGRDRKRVSERIEMRPGEERLDLVLTFGD